MTEYTAEYHELEQPKKTCACLELDGFRVLSSKIAPRANAGTTYDVWSCVYGADGVTIEITQEDIKKSLFDLSKKGITMGWQAREFKMSGSQAGVESVVQNLTEKGVKLKLEEKAA